MNVKKININQSPQTYYIASDIYDVSANNNDATFESLSSLLSSSNLNTLIPTAVRYGGMTIRFIQSSDNKYVQYRLMANTWSTTVADWQGIDDEPTAESDNLVKSGGVANAIETETARAKAAEEANTNAIHKGVDAYFAFSGLTLTDTQISFVQYSFVYIKDPLLNEYVRYIIKPGTYDLPNTSNRCLYVTPSITDDGGNLIPTVSTEEVHKLQTNSYIIGVCNSIGKFFLSDASAVYQANLNGGGNKKWVEHYFVLENTKVTDATISFSKFSFLYVKNLETNNFVRYIIEPGTYELPNLSNRALYVSTSIKSENDYLIPTTSKTEFRSLSSDCYPLGICNSNGKFLLSNAAAVYSANKYEINTNKR